MEEKDGSKAGGFSFGFKSKSNTGPLKTKSAINEVVEEREETDFIKGVDGSEIKSVKESKKSNEPLVIPLIAKNVWRDDTASSKSKHKTLDTKDVESRSSTLDDLSKKAAEELLADVKRRNEEDHNEETNSSFAIPLLMQNQIPDGFETDENLNTDLRPDESTLEDYQQVPIEQYGLAILRGMGWKDGDGIGKNKKHIKPVEPHLRPKGMGLGADRSSLLQQKGNKSRYQLKPGDQKEEEPLMFKKGVHCVILKGPHIDLYATIQALDEDNCRCIVKLSLSQETVTISQFNIKLVDKKEFDKYSRYLNKGKSDRYKEKESKNGSHRDTSPPPKKHKHDKSDNSRTSPHSIGGSSKVNHQGDYRHRWIQPLLKVKIIDRKYKDGRYYTSKVVVEDVLPQSIICKSESGRLLEGLKEDQLETVIPKEDNSYVMVVSGQHKKKIGQIKQRNKDKEKVTIQLLDDRSVLVKLHYDDVCQYEGNVDHLLEY